MYYQGEYAESLSQTHVISQKTTKGLAGNARLRFSSNPILVTSDCELAQT